jgi:hypothetical protein
MVIGDLHCPCDLDSYLEFCLENYEAYECGHTVFIGDVANCGLISYHEFDPEWPYSPAQEIDITRERIAKWESAFPDAHVMTGNHDALPYRKAKTAGIPRSMIRDPEEIWETETWTWHPRFTTYFYDDVAYRHGDRGKGGQFNPAFKNAKELFVSLVQGHFHGQAGIEWYCNEYTKIFGMQVGSGMDWHRMEMDYGVKFNQKPMISCGIVHEGKPYVEVMDL